MNGKRTRLFQTGCFHPRTWRLTCVLTMQSTLGTSVYRNQPISKELTDLELILRIRPPDVAANTRLKEVRQRIVQQPPAAQK